ncbi:MAG: peptide deformylase [Chloroflexota bacterium]
MAILPIYNCFHPILREKAQKVEQIDDRINQLVRDMYETLYNISNGVGLAANQVGDRASVIVIDTSIGDKNRQPRPITMINPVIAHFSEETAEEAEGCLSIPELFEQVERPISVQVEYVDVNGKEHKEEASDFLARVMQHEIDHLNGILFTDRLTALRKILAKNKLKKIKSGQVETDYPMINPPKNKR